MTKTKIGFIGTGVMGEPMAVNMVKASIPLVVWNRTRDKLKNLKEAGAETVDTAEQVFKKTHIVILMLVDGTAIDAVTGRGTDNFDHRVNGHTLIHMGTTSPEYSRGLEADIINAGGRYIEAPVSGSRKPAEEGKLVVMLAGKEHESAELKSLLAPMCSSIIGCGPVPNAILMKLSVNILLTSMMTGLAEALNFASCNDLDLDRFFDVLKTGPMANDIIRVKAPKLLNQDFSAQATISNVLENTRLIVEAAGQCEAYAPLISTCLKLYEHTSELGLGELDVVSVLKAFEKKGVYRIIQQT